MLKAMLKARCYWDDHSYSPIHIFAHEYPVWVEFQGCLFFHQKNGIYCKSSFDFYSHTYEQPPARKQIQ